MSCADGGIIWTLGNLSGLTTNAGRYTITLTASGSGIVDAARNPLVTGASIVFVVNAVQVPATIGTVTPNPVTGSTAPQSLTITGTNFNSGSIVRLKNMTTGTTIASATVTSRTATQLVINQIFGTASANWTAEVLNGMSSSNAFAFSVLATTQLGIRVSPNPISGKTATLYALNGGTNTTTKFVWSVMVKPTGATTPTFSANNTNAAKASTITFFKAVTYTLKLTSTTGSLLNTETYTFTVKQIFTSIGVSPSNAIVQRSKTQQFVASAMDQFGAAMAASLAFSWSIDFGGVGSVSGAGLYTAPGTNMGTAKVRATAGTISTIAAVSVSSKINFQPAAAAAVSGYLIDSGATYAARNGISYGWNVSHSDSVVDRAKNSNQFLDTSIGLKIGAKWEIEIPNGSYLITISVGDALIATTNTLRIEGAIVFDAVKLAENIFTFKTFTINVTDGKLTLDNITAGNLSTRLNCIEITKA